MKYIHYLASLCLLFSTYCYSQDYQIEDKYRGDPFFRKIDMNKLEKDCTYPLDYWQLDNTKQKEIDKLCPLNYLKFDFTSLHKFIYQGPRVIYNGQDFQLTLSMPLNEYDIAPETILGREISLSIINDNIVKDKIYLANNFMSIGELSVAYQRYYISQQGDIYTLYLGESDAGILPILWKHYQIDTQTMKFKLIQIDWGSVKITLPDNFTALPNPEQKVNYKDKEFKKCLKDETSEGCFDFKVYFYYLEQLKSKMELLTKKQKDKKNRFSLFKQKLDKKCLATPLPFDDDELHHYLNNLYSCEIKGFKEELSRIEKQLAH
ncbi:hypothetical protein [Gilliamella apicola]|uniref:YARHG domain-containing protein n=1 Tax=Gilliamella apicola TaxID=1196095 RepID=A0A242NKR5_9GAMM|nr:hypothetical protein [Gilliamella apicola]OTP83778.1 hypothetical protein B5S40_02175 [Gilliamella apicola]OTP86222.1 hypothetical protein B5S44_01445 [Gilliamella apicola]OTP86987.1 hypothetical protein B5S42_11740 [Gilliamella apicola]OTQ01041.1 hypothetical protein B6D08_02605 [Gilliamella apicola]OTQ11846.1 hypothetical protein B6C91_00965 [Gilliamella apicola]